MTPIGTAARRLARAARGRSVRSSSWAMVGQLASVVASAANFLLLARLIGPTEYGLVAGTWALVLAVQPIASLGSERLLIRDISGGRLPANQALGAGLLTLSGGGLLVVGGLVALHSVLLPQTPLLLLASLAVADILAGGVAVLVGALCFSTGNARAAAVSAIAVSTTKLLAVVVFALVSGDAVTWALLYAAFSVVSAVGQITWVLLRFGRPSVQGYRFLGRTREGLPYTGHLIAGVAQRDADKVILVRYGLVAETGLYSVAYRLTSMAFLPVLAVLQVMFPRYFALGSEGGLTATTALARRMAVPLLTYGAVAAVLLAAVTPVLPLLLGEQYRGSSRFLLLLAPLLMFKVVQTVSGDALTGAGLQGKRTLCVSIAAGVNIALNIVLIPVMGVLGAVVATYVAEAAQVALLLLTVRRGLARQRESPPAPSVAA